MTVESWHRGDWMQTFTGAKFYPMSPRPEDVDPLDIAHALGNLCRYAGHVDRFYSVAEHCVLMSRAVPVKYALEALLHDATEAYVVDVPRPLKLHLPDYRAVEDRVADVIAQRFGREMFWCAIEPEGEFGWHQIESLPVREADSRILLDERAALMSRTRYAWGVDGLVPLGVQIHAWSPAQAENEYLLRLEELGALS